MTFIFSQEIVMDQESRTHNVESVSDKDRVDSVNSYDWFSLMKSIGNSLSFSSFTTSTDSIIGDKEELEEEENKTHAKFKKSSWLGFGFSYPLYTSLPEQYEKGKRAKKESENEDSIFCNNSSIIGSKKHRFLCLYFISQMILGNFFGQIGTTIIDLADQLGYDSATDLNYIYVMDFLGNLAGSIIGGVIIEYLYGVDVKMIIALGFLGLGITDVFIPMQTSFVYLAIGISLCEAFYAIVEAGVQNSITRMYGLNSSTILNYGNIWFAAGVAWTPVIMNMFDSLLDKFLSIAIPAMILGPIWLLVDLYDAKSETNINTLGKTLSSNGLFKLGLLISPNSSPLPSKRQSVEKNEIETTNEEEEFLIDGSDNIEQNEKQSNESSLKLSLHQQETRGQTRTPPSSPSRNNSPRSPLPGYDLTESNFNTEGGTNNVSEVPAYESFESTRGKIMVAVFLLLQFCVIGALSSFTNWSSFYLFEQGLSTDTGGAAYSISIIWSGVALGSMVSAYLQSRYQIHSLEKILYPLICLPVLALTPIIIFPLNLNVLYTSYAVFGFFLGPVQGLLFKLSNSLLEPTGLIMAFHITGMMTGSSLVPWIEGYYIDIYSMSLIYSVVGLLAFAVLVIFCFYEIHQVISPFSRPSNNAERTTLSKEV